MFLHGLMGSAANWRPIVKRFEAEGYCLTYDQRGHGRSFHPSSGYGPKDYAQDLKILLDELNWQKIRLIGHSMGARNALQFADLYPDQLEALVMVDMGPKQEVEPGRRIEHWIRDAPVPFVSRAAAQTHFRGEFVRLFGQGDRAERLVGFFMMNIVEVSPGVWDWRFSRQGLLESLIQGRALSLWTEWERLKCPVLVIRGEESEDLTEETFKEMLKRQPRASGSQIPNAGHWVHADQPEEVVKSLQSFFATLVL